MAPFSRISRGMSASLTRMKFRLEGLDHEDVSWAHLSVFVDHLVQAIAAMDGGPQATEILPLAVDNSGPHLVIGLPKEPGQKAVRQLHRGPTRRWTPQQRRRADPLYRFLETNQYRLACGVRRFKTIPVPKDRLAWHVHESMSLHGEVRRAGGPGGGADMVFREHGPLHCDATREVSKRLGAHLYGIVTVWGHAETDPITGALLSFRIHGFRPHDRVTPVQ